jgi:hypothetical protein
LARPALLIMTICPDLLPVQKILAQSRPTSLAMRLLAAGVPLTLLIDLCAVDGPDSRAIIALERETTQPQTPLA